MFPDNEFWQCPSWAITSVYASIILGVIMFIAIKVFGTESAYYVAVGGGLVMLFLLCRTVYHWFSPDARCETKGFPGQHYGSPFYKP